jgi:hypothetical protein
MHQLFIAVKRLLHEVIEWLYSEMWPEVAQELEQEVNQYSPRTGNAAQ